MTINHLNLVVTDTVNAINFFETYFGFKSEATKGDNIIAILKNAAGFTLVLMTSKETGLSYPKDFHFGFMVDSPEEVEMIYRALLKGLIDVPRPPGKIRNNFAFYIHFDNLFIEVGHYLQSPIEKQ